MKMESIKIYKITYKVVKLKNLMIQMIFQIRYMNNKATKNTRFYRTMFKSIIKYKNIYFKKSLKYLKSEYFKLIIKLNTKQQLISLKIIRLALVLWFSSIK